MTDTITHLDIAIHDRVDRLQSRLHDLKDRVAPGGGKLDSGVEALEKGLDASKNKIGDAYASIDNWVDVKLDDLYAWQENREVDRLLKQSEKSQRHAEAALDVALNALDEAELSMAKASIAEFSARAIAPTDQVSDL